MMRATATSVQQGGTAGQAGASCRLRAAHHFDTSMDSKPAASTMCCAREPACAHASKRSARCWLRPGAPRTRGPPLAGNAGASRNDSRRALNCSWCLLSTPSSSSASSCTTASAKATHTSSEMSSQPAGATRGRTLTTCGGGGGGRRAGGLARAAAVLLIASRRCRAVTSDGEAHRPVVQELRLDEEAVVGVHAEAAPAGAREEEVVLRRARARRGGGGGGGRAREGDPAEGRVGLVEGQRHLRGLPRPARASDLTRWRRADARLRRCATDGSRAWRDCCFLWNALVELQDSRRMARSAPRGGGLWRRRGAFRSRSRR